MKFVRIHIPKTGGCTFRDILLRQFAACHEAVLNNPRGAAEVRAMSTAEKLDYDVVGGHVLFGFDPQLPSAFEYVTLLREPVSRTLSVYGHLMHLQTTTELARRVRREGWSLVDFARSTDREAIPLVHSNLVMLAGDTVESGQSVVDRAVDNLYAHFSFVGITERFDESMVLFEERFGADARYRPRNVTPASKRVDVTHAEVRELREILAFEIELYLVASSILNERLDRVSNLSAKVSRLRSRCDARRSEASLAS